MEENKEIKGKKAQEPEPTNTKQENNSNNDETPARETGEKTVEKIKKEAPKDPGASEEKGDYSVKVDTVERDAAIARNIEKIQKIQNFFAPSDFSRQLKIFSLKYQSFPLSPKQISTAEELLVYPQEKLDAMGAMFRKNRILLLTGEMESGKYLTAKYLAGRMQKESSEDIDIRLVKSLEEDTLIRLFELIAKKKVLKKKILIFSNAFSKKNKNLLDFFASYSKEQTEYIAQRLSELEAFILFTADSNTYKEDQLSHLEIKYEIVAVDSPLLERGYRLKLKHYCDQKEIDFENTAAILKSKKKEILSKLGQMSKISVFIDQYLQKILESTEKSMIDQAIEEVNNIKKRVDHWFREELVEDKKKNFESWTFAICLALFNEIPFVDFITIHETVTRRLLKALYPFESNEDFSFCPSENLLLKKCNAKITEGSGLQPDIIEFRDSRYREALLDILMGGYQKVLLLLVPILKKIVGSNSHYKLRQFAASGLASIGLLAPDAIIISLIREWANREDNVLRTSVGYLYEGVVLTGSETYKKYCLTHLKNMALSNNLDIQWTAIAAYKQIGLRDLEFAMKELKIIQEKIIDSILEISKTRDWLDMIYEKTGLIAEETVRANLHFLHEETNALLSTIHYSLVALCIMKDPIDVLSELQKWFEDGEEAARGTMVFFILLDDGLLHMLEKRYVIYFSDEEESEQDADRCNILLESLTTSKDAVTRLVDFLKTLYKDGFSAFKPEDRPSLRRVLLKHLENWVVNSLPDSKVRDALKDFVVAFYESGDKALKRSLYHSMRQWRAPDKEEELDKFRTSVSKKIFKI